jgi:hypothetical protein
MKWVYHGEIVAHFADGYCLLRFDNSDKLPTGTHEVVHISRIADEKWSLFENANQLQTVLVDGASG